MKIFQRKQFTRIMFLYLVFNSICHTIEVMNRMLIGYRVCAKNKHEKKVEKRVFRKFFGVCNYNVRKTCVYANHW